MTATETLDQAYGPQNYSIRRYGRQWVLAVWHPLRLADGTESASRGGWQHEDWVPGGSYESAVERFAKRVQEKDAANGAPMKEGVDR